MELCCRLRMLASMGRQTAAADRMTNPSPVTVRFSDSRPMESSPPLFPFTNGAYPNGLSQGLDGDFYGTTRGGGDKHAGIIFKITTNGTFTSLLSFNGTNGISPQALLCAAKDGCLYGS